MQHLVEWNGKPVKDFRPSVGITDPTNTAYRISIEYDGGRKGKGKTFTDAFSEFLDDPRSSEVTSVVTGLWATWVSGREGEGIEGIVALLVGASERLPHLTSLFIADLSREDCEISWIPQGDLSPLFGAFPQLEALGIRGSQELTLGIPRHAHLKKLVIESGGLPVSVLHEIAAADLPALEHLELYLGDSGYGWDGTIDDLKPFFDGTRWPNLTYLGLRDSEIADEIAGHLATSPILERIKVLDLSLGNLSNPGAEALLYNQTALARLEKLDLHHHFLSEGMVLRLQELGITIDASDPQDEDEYDGEIYRYVAVSE